MPGRVIEARERTDRRTHAPRKYARFLQADGLKRICIWGAPPMAEQSMWNRLCAGDTKCAVLLRERATKIVRSRQRDGQYRYDLYLSARASMALFLLRKRFTKVGWYIRLHESYSKRKEAKSSRNNAAPAAPGNKRGSPRPANAANGQSRGENTITTHAKKARRVRWKCPPVTLASLNVNSAGSKLGEIEMFLRETGVQILGLQETWMKSDDDPLILRGFRCFEVPVQAGVGSSNGLAVFVKNELNPRETGVERLYSVSVQFEINGDPWTFVNCYIPIRDNAHVRKLALASLRDELVRVLTPGAKVVVGGDLNMKISELERIMRKWDLPIQLMKCRGSPVTYHKSRQWTVTDHFLASSEASRCIPYMCVNRRWASMSDHFPIQADIIVRKDRERGRAAASNAAEAPAAPISYSRAKIAAKAAEITSHNRWAALAEGDEDDAMANAEALAHAVQNAISEVALQTGVATRETRAEAARAAQRPLLDHRTKKAIERRNSIYLKFKHASKNGRAKRLRREYLRAKTLAGKLSAGCLRRHRQRVVRRGVQWLSGERMRDGWRWLKSTMRGASTSRNAADGPLRRGDALVSEKGDVMKAWVEHFSELLADTTTHSRNADYWSQQFPGPGKAPLPGLNDPFTWGELNDVLHSMKSGKAPGEDGILPELLKTAYEPAGAPDFDPNNPRSPFGKALLRLANAMFLRGVPTSINTAVLVPIPKPGDHTLRDNFRGIALIGVLLKMVTNLVVRRIELGLEMRGYIRREQAAFRSREECVAQATALFEILQRRSRTDTTFVCFVDVRKAYDTVPHEALLRKLELAGVHGNALRFIRTLYGGSLARVRTSWGLSDPIPVERGVRQGCPASPLLFNVFINDILDGCTDDGVRVPRMLGPLVPGLLFADDLALLAETEAAMLRLLERIEQWGVKNEMSFGVSKCGIMGIGENGMARVRAMAGQWRLGGEVIPVVEEYKYLGLMFRYDLNLGHIARVRALKGVNALHALRPTLQKHHLPVKLRTMLIKSLLMPVLCYGGELWGMSSQRAQDADRVLRQAMRSVVGKSSNALVSQEVLRRELKVPSVYAATAARRSRLWVKAPTMRTVIRQLAQRPARQSWSSTSRAWLKRAKIDVQGLSAEMVAHAALAHADAVAPPDKRPKSLVRYRGARLHKSTGYMDIPMQVPDLAAAFYWLTRARVGNIYMVPQLVLGGRIADDRFLQCCPWCNAEVPEDLVHLMLHCERWSDARGRYLGRFIDIWSAQRLVGLAAEAKDATLTMLLLGGRRSRVHHIAGTPLQRAEERRLQRLWYKRGAIGDEVRVLQVVESDYLPLEGIAAVRRGQRRPDSDDAVTPSRLARINAVWPGGSRPYCVEVALYISLVMRQRSTLIDEISQ